jgi:hypothetical protein
MKTGNIRKYSDDPETTWPDDHIIIYRPVISSSDRVIIIYQTICHSACCCSYRGPSTSRNRPTITDTLLRLHCANWGYVTYLASSTVSASNCCPLSRSGLAEIHVLRRASAIVNTITSSAVSSVRVELTTHIQIRSVGSWIRRVSIQSCVLRITGRD